MLAGSSMRAPMGSLMGLLMGALMGLLVGVLMGLVVVLWMGASMGLLGGGGLPEEDAGAGGLADGVERVKMDLLMGSYGLVGLHLILVMRRSRLSGLLVGFLVGVNGANGVGEGVNGMAGGSAG